MSATLEPKSDAINGGEFHQIHFDIDEDGILNLEIDAQCYGTHSSSFQMAMYAIGPDELERFGFDIISLAKKMREIDAKKD
jgi:hypothetical protein